MAVDFLEELASEGEDILHHPHLLFGVEKVCAFPHRLVDALGVDPDASGFQQNLVLQGSVGSFVGFFHHCVNRGCVRWYRSSSLRVLLSDEVEVSQVSSTTHYNTATFHEAHQVEVGVD